jgi:hypothetical protein
MIPRVRPLWRAGERFSFARSAPRALRGTRGENKVSTLNKTLNLFTWSIAISFVLFGFCIAVDAFDLAYLDAKFRILFGVIFILYGLLRLAMMMVKATARREI